MPPRKDKGPDLRFVEHLVAGATDAELDDFARIGRIMDNELQRSAGLSEAQRRDLRALDRKGLAEESFTEAEIRRYERYTEKIFRSPLAKKFTGAAGPGDPPTSPEWVLVETVTFMVLKLLREDQLQQARGVLDAKEVVITEVLVKFIQSPVGRTLAQAGHGILEAALLSVENTLRRKAGLKPKERYALSPAPEAKKSRVEKAGEAIDEKVEILRKFKEARAMLKQLYADDPEEQEKALKNLDRWAFDQKITDDEEFK